MIPQTLPPEDQAGKPKRLLIFLITLVLLLGIQYPILFLITGLLMHGSVDKFKARLVARGYTQQEDIDYLENISPVVKFTTVRLFLCLAAVKHWDLYQLDANNAFLNGDLSEEVYMALPSGYTCSNPSLKFHVCMLHKSIYGLKQASRQWNEKFTTAILNVGFVQSNSDYSLFVRGSGDSLIALLIYGYDMVIAGPKSANIPALISDLGSIFRLRDLGPLKYFLGMEIARSSSGITVSQRSYTLNLLEEISYSESKPVSLTMDQKIRLNIEDGEIISDPFQYRSLIVKLIYLTHTRPDILFAVNRLSQFVSKPRTSDLQATHYLLRFLKASPGQIIFFSAHSYLSLKGFSDADWGSCADTRRSTKGVGIISIIISAHILELNVYGYLTDSPIKVINLSYWIGLYGY
ncbi:hypothetical protein CASFOL_028148 [Castilleja foliolosa]|uniref:Reverse transcriptase Ty1/copia-type domain-containing protein n=1 Tax=Castilleja foliolosa TaxID=1961234 RepID=A0ABD3CG92_9LAMI